MFRVRNIFVTAASNRKEPAISDDYRLFGIVDCGLETGAEVQANPGAFVKTCGVQVKILMRY